MKGLDESDAKIRAARSRLSERGFELLRSGAGDYGKKESPAS
jgi:hypothetical protein